MDSAFVICILFVYTHSCVRKAKQQVMHVPPANFDHITLHLLSAAARHATHPAGPQQLSVCTSLQHLYGKHVGCLACKAHKHARHPSLQGTIYFTLIHLPHCACSMLSPQSVACSSIEVILWHIKHTTPSLGNLILTSSKDTQSELLTSTA